MRGRLAVPAAGAAGPVPARPPVARLSVLYLLIFAALGAHLPYWTLYLQSTGLDAARIGELLALAAAIRVVAPPLWGSVADRRGRRMPVVRVAAQAAAVVFGLVLVHQGYWWFAAVTFAFQLAWSGVLPQFEAVTLAHLGREGVRYPRVRLWGSIGFVATTLAVGALLEGRPMMLAPAVVWVLLVACAAWALLVPEPAPPADAPREDAAGTALLGRPAVLVFLASSALMAAAHGPYYVLFSIHLSALGYSEGLIGVLWSLGVVAEIGLFAIMPRILGRYRLPDLLLVCFVLTAARWLAIGLLSHHVGALAAAQTLHAVSFALHHVVAVQLVYRLFPGNRSGRGQALYAGLGSGAGGVLGSVAAGHVWTAYGPAATWTGAAAAAGAGGLLAWWLRRRWAGEPAIAGPL